MAWQMLDLASAIHLQFSRRCCESAHGATVDYVRRYPYIMVESLYSGNAIKHYTVPQSPHKTMANYHSVAYDRPIILR